MPKGKSKACPSSLVVASFKVHGKVYEACAKGKGKPAVTLLTEKQMGLRSRGQALAAAKHAKVAAAKAAAAAAVARTEQDAKDRAAESLPSRSRFFGYRKRSRRSRR